MYKVKFLPKKAGRIEVIMNAKDAFELGVREQDRIRVVGTSADGNGVVETSTSMVQEGEVLISRDGFDALKLEEGQQVDIVVGEKPRSVEFIKRKMDGAELTTEEIKTIVDDIQTHTLTDIELAAYVTAVYINGMNMRETTDLAMSMVKGGDLIEFSNHPIFDFHSVGGVPGNKITLIVVPIIAAAGLTIPKTSSRAISSACGTADIFETLCNVTLSGHEIKRITDKVGGVIAWGGGVNIAPADDIIIRAEYPLSLDPHAQLLASVLAKKKAVGADYVLIDIPMGPNTKVPDDATAKRYARDFIELGERMGMHVECAITYGGQPVGRGIGPLTEAKEALTALEGGPVSNSLIEKSIAIASIVLEMGGIQNGRAKAKEMLQSGKALEKFLQILGEQGGNPELKSQDIELGKYTAEITANTHGYVKGIHNKNIVKIVRECGAPKDGGAGLILTKKEGHSVEEGEVLYTLYADNKNKLDRAVALANHLRPIHVEGMILAHVPSHNTIAVNR